MRRKADGGNDPRSWYCIFIATPSSRHPFSFLAFAPSSEYLKCKNALLPTMRTLSRGPHSWKWSRTSFSVVPCPRLPTQTCRIGAWPRRTGCGVYGCFSGSYSSPFSQWGLCSIILSTCKENEYTTSKKNMYLDDQPKIVGWWHPWTIRRILWTNWRCSYPLDKWLAIDSYPSDDFSTSSLVLRVCLCLFCCLFGDFTPGKQFATVFHDLVSISGITPVRHDAFHDCRIPHAYRRLQEQDPDQAVHRRPPQKSQARLRLSCQQAGAQAPLVQSLQGKACLVQQASSA